MRLATILGELVLGVFLSLLCTKVVADTRVVIEKPEKDVWIIRKFKNDRPLEVSSYRWFKIEPRGSVLTHHGNSTLFDGKGDVAQSKWYFRGESVTSDEFKTLSETAVFEAQRALKETPEGKEAREFITQLSLAWHRRDYEGCKTIIERKLADKPGWIPAIIAEYGYYTFIDRDYSKAATTLGSIEDTLNEIANGPNMDRKTAYLWKALLGMYYHYYEQSKATKTGKIVTFIGRRTVDVGNARDTWLVFPLSDLMVAYFVASDTRVNISEVQKRLTAADNRSRE